MAVLLGSLGSLRRLGTVLTRMTVNSARSLLAQKREATITILALSLWTPCLLLTLGLRSGIQRQADQFLVSAMHAREGRILYETLGVPLDKSPDYAHRWMDLEALRNRFSNMALFAGFCATPTEVSTHGSHGKKVAKVILAAVEPEYYAIRDFTVLAGSLPDEQDERMHARVCVVDETLAKELGLGANPIGRTVFVWGVPFTVQGLRKDEPLITSAPLINHNRYFQIPMGTGNRILFREDGPDLIAFLVRPGYQVQSVARSIEQFVLSRYPNCPPGESPLRVVTGLSMASRMRSSVRPMVVTGGILAALSGFAGFAMLATVLFMYVSQMRREIAIRRAVGASQRAVKTEFAATAALLCLLGMALGTIMGGVAYWMIEKHPITTASGFPKYPMALTGADVATVLLVNVLGLLLSLRASLRFIARLSPAEALRG